MGAQPSTLSSRSRISTARDPTARRYGVNLTVIVPVHDEAENVRPLHTALEATLRSLGRSYEVIIVDDGSRDDTYGRLGEHRSADESHSS